MSITINLNAVEAYSGGVNYDAYMKSYFTDFAFNGWPYILGGPGEFQGNQIVLLDNLAERNTKTIVLDGANIVYTLANHKVTGTLTGVALGTLGNSFVAPSAFTQSASENIINYAAPIQITGLSIAGSDFHDLVAGLMNSGNASDPADPSVLRDALASQAHNVIGSAGADAYTGTQFKDTISGNEGDDRLTGAGGSDILTGGVGADRFVFQSPGDSTMKAKGRDVIMDFSQPEHDVIGLSAIDANTTKGGNQRFTFIGDDGFSREAGELRFIEKGSDTYVYGDVDGNGKVDFSIRLDDIVSLTAQDFLL